MAEPAHYLKLEFNYSWQQSAVLSNAYARRGLGSCWEVTTMPANRATSMAPNATVPRMRPMLLAAVDGTAQRLAAVVDAAPSAAKLAHTSTSQLGQVVAAVKVDVAPGCSTQSPTKRFCSTPNVLWSM